MKLYTLENCPPCEYVKRIFALNKVEVPTVFIWRDMEKNDEVTMEEIHTLGIKSFPTLLTDLDTLISDSSKIIAHVRNFYER